MFKCGSDFKIANCALEGQNTGLFYLASLFVLHFFFNNNSTDSSEFFIFLFLCQPRG